MTRQRIARQQTKMTVPYPETQRKIRIWEKAEVPIPVFTMEIQTEMLRKHRATEQRMEIQQMEIQRMAVKRILLFPRRHGSWMKAVCYARSLRNCWKSTMAFYIFRRGFLQEYGKMRFPVFPEVFTRSWSHPH